MKKGKTTEVSLIAFRPFEEKRRQVDEVLDISQVSLIAFKP